MMQQYKPRIIRFHRVEEYGGWKIKLYSITWDGELIDSDSFERAVSFACNELPHPAVTAVRPGFGFLIFHRGAVLDYLVISWWDRENELPTRVFVREESDADWRPASGGKSFCVWDLEVFWFERHSYISTFLSGAEEPHPDHYLSSIAGVNA